MNVADMKENCEGCLFFWHKLDCCLNVNNNVCTDEDDKDDVGLALDTAVWNKCPLFAPNLKCREVQALEKIVTLLGKFSKS